MAISTFERIEKKYLLSEQKYNALMKRLEGKMTVDSYGKHTICNIYYDTDSFELIRASIEKPVYKEKLRLRSYGVPNEESKVFLEIKKKYKGVVYKRRVQMTLEEADRYLTTGERTAKTPLENQIFGELDYFVKFHNVQPKMFIAYDRIAMFGNEDKSLRMTFDTDIRSREYSLELSKGDNGELLLEKGTHLMELKAVGAMPLWLADILCELEIYPTSFSKYGSIYKKKIASQSIVKENTEKRSRNICSQVFLTVPQQVFQSKTH